MSTNLESVPTINMPSEIKIPYDCLFHFHDFPMIEVKKGNILEPVIIGWKVYYMDGKSVKEPIYNYKIKGT